MWSCRNLKLNLTLVHRLSLVSAPLKLSKTTSQNEPPRLDIDYGSLPISQKRTTDRSTGKGLDIDSCSYASTEIKHLRALGTYYL